VAAVTTSDAHKAVDAVWRIEAPRLIAGLARMVRDVGRAEELAQEALVVALEKWPTTGVPKNPGAWLMQTAKHRAIDQLRRRPMLERSHDAIARDLDAEQERAVEALDDTLDDDVGDDLLRLVFTACHPVLSRDARVALTLRLLGGLTTDEIARAFLVGEPTIAQRIVRAKKTLAEAQVPFEVPRGPERAARTASVLEVIYLVFNEGYAATAGEDWTRPELCQDALRLARILAALLPEEASVQGMLALLELQASRLRARTDASGAPVLLLDQNRARWDHLQIARGLTALARAEALSSTRDAYTLQAAIAACHARARRADETDWTRIAQLYTELLVLLPTPVVALNRAVAISMAIGPEVALPLVEALESEKALAGYHLLPSVRADLLMKLGRLGEAKVAFEAAASLTRNERERAFLLERAASCAAKP
jgi:RNA polymerase sigma factor (sigma-70 family)